MNVTIINNACGGHDPGEIIVLFATASGVQVALN